MTITKEEIKKILADIKNGEKLLEYIEMLEKEIEELKNPNRKLKKDNCSDSDVEIKNTDKNKPEDEENMTPAQKYFKKGELCHKMCHIDEAIKYYTKAIELEPDNIQYYEKRAYCYFAWAEYDEDFENAIKDYTKVIESNPKNLLDMLDERAECYENIGELEKAIEDYKAIIEIDPSHIGAYMGRAHCYIYTEKYDEAIKDLTKIIESYSDNLKFIEHRAHCYKKIKDYDNAISDYKKFLEMTGDCYPDIFYELGYLYFKKGENEEANMCYKKACELEPEKNYQYYEK